jgi:hypothetical protein
MQDVATGITADSVLIGGASAEASVAGNEDADTSGWKPGDTATATRRAGELGLAPLLPGGGGSGGGDIPDVGEAMGDGYLNVVSRVLAGWDPDTAAGELGDMLAEAVADGAYAEGLTITQITVVAGQAALGWYLSNDVAFKSWVTLDDGRVCPGCYMNQDAGSIPVGQEFPDGHMTTPGHDRCRCACVGSAPPSQS